jgi:hypothetical protein
MLIRISGFDGGSTEPWGTLVVDTDQLPHEERMEDGRVVVEVVNPTQSVIPHGPCPLCKGTGSMPITNGGEPSIQLEE